MHMPGAAHLQQVPNWIRAHCVPTRITKWLDNFSSDKWIDLMPSFLLKTNPPPQKKTACVSKSHPLTPSKTTLYTRDVNVYKKHTRTNLLWPPLLISLRVLLHSISSLPFPHLSSFYSLSWETEIQTYVGRLYVTFYFILTIIRYIENKARLNKM